MNINKLLNIKIGKISFDIFIIPTILFACIFDYPDLFFISFTSVLVHELAHIFCAKFLHIGISHIEIHPFGVCAILKDGYINNSEKEFLIAFTGPFTSIFVATLTAIFKPINWEYIFDINICICAINLLPVLPLDGGRMFKSMLTYKMGILRAYNISRKFSKLLIVILIIISVAVMLKSRFNLTYALITAFLIGNIYDEQKNITLVTLREIIESPCKTMHLKKTKVFSVSAQEYVRNILKFISYDYFLTVNITKDGKIIATLTEEQILHALSDNGINLTYSDIIQSGY